MASEQCEVQSIRGKVDLCEYARSVAWQMSGAMPFHLGYLIYLQDAYSLRSAVHVNGYIDMTWAELEAMSEQNQEAGIHVMSQAGFEEHHKSDILIEACQLGTLTRGFMDLGGEITYDIHFKDGQRYFTQKILTCNRRQ